MLNFLYGFAIGAICIATPAFIHGFICQWRKDKAQINKDLIKLLDDFDRQYARYSNTPEYKKQLAKFKESNGGS